MFLNPLWEMWVLPACALGRQPLAGCILPGETEAQPPQITHSRRPHSQGAGRQGLQGLSDRRVPNPNRVECSEKVTVCLPQRKDAPTKEKQKGKEGTGGQPSAGQSVSASEQRARLGKSGFGLVW